MHIFRAVKKKKSITFCTCLISLGVSSPAGHHDPCRGAERVFLQGSWCNAHRVMVHLDFYPLPGQGWNPSFKGYLGIVLKSHKRIRGRNRMGFGRKVT